MRCDIEGHGGSGFDRSHRRFHTAGEPGDRSARVRGSTGGFRNKSSGWKAGRLALFGRFTHDGPASLRTSLNPPELKKVLLNAMVSINPRLQIPHDLKIELLINSITSVDGFTNTCDYRNHSDSDLTRALVQLSIEPEEFVALAGGCSSSAAALWLARCKSTDEGRHVQN
jgi:hypothetical protein